MTLQGLRCCILSAAVKKAASRLPFFSDGRYISQPGPQKKARGPGRLRADGKIPSRGQFEGTGSVQESLTSATELSFRNLGEIPVLGVSSLALSVFLVFRIGRLHSADPEKSGYCSGFLPHPLIIQCFSGGDAPHQGLVCQCIVGETYGDGSNKMYRFASR